MIELNCTNCNKVLSIDDAFAGGVCRCQHCGTIQTVPAKGQARAANPSVAASAEAGSPKSLYKRKARIESALSPFNDGLDEAADQIPSSGLSNSSLVSGVQRRPATATATATASGGDVPLSSQIPMSGMGQAGGLANPPVMNEAQAARHAAHHPVAVQARTGRRRLLTIGASAVFAIALGVGGWWYLGHSTQDSAGGENGGPKVVAADSPQLEGISLEGASIVYILDRSGCSNQTFREMVRVCGKSVATLGTTRQFKVLVMGADKIVAFPGAGMKNATPAANESFTDAFGREFYVGQKNAAAVFRKAMEEKCDTLVLISANDDHATLYETLSPVLGEKPRPVKVFYVGSSDSSPGLSLLAQSTGGEYNKLNLSAVK